VTRLRTHEFDRYRNEIRSISRAESKCQKSFAKLHTSTESMEPTTAD
jgi:hypothetical protein